MMNRVDLNQAGQMTNLSRWIIISFSGLVIAWGSFPQWNNAQRVNQMAPPPTSGEGVLSAGASHTCGIKSDGIVVCWGDNSRGQLSGIPNGTFTQVSASNDHTCGIKKDGTITCWGSNLFGQLTAIPIPSGSFMQVSAGGLCSCALRSNGSVACWKHKQAPIVTVPWSPKFKPSLNFNNILGLCSPLSRSTFVQISGLCGIKSNGSLACWHYNWSTNAVTPSLNLPSGPFKQISVGGFLSCGIKRNNTLVCWGNNRELNPTGQITNTPSGIFKQVSSGTSHACALKSDGSAVCWEYNWGSNTLELSPHTPSGTFRQVSAGASHTCGIKSDGTVACWGDNSRGQLNNVPTAVFGPPAVSAKPLPLATSITDGTHHTLRYNISTN